LIRAAVKKNPINSKRNMFIRIQALRWVEKNRPEVFQAIKEPAKKKYAPKGQRKRTELDAELLPW
jgi:hypothetical protein